MRIGIITEGHSEFSSLPFLYPQFNERSGHTLLRPLKLSICPDAPPNVIAREAKARILLATAKKADLIVIVLDREQQQTCAGDLAASIETAIVRLCVRSATVRVVLKDRAYENWLIADLEALREQAARFTVTKAIERTIAPNKSDGVDGYRILTKLTAGDYDKVKDSVRICAKMDVTRASMNSRSLRHFLHVIGDSVYGAQCRRPFKSSEP